MKKIDSVLLLFLLVIGGSLQAQGWKDYIIGKPDMQYIELKKAVAKAWGLDYKVYLMGCEYSDEIKEQEQKIATENALYFKQLEQQYGKNWQQYFELDIAKKRFASQEQKIAVWQEAIVGKPDMQYIKAKQAAAKAWGIQYQPQLLGCSMDAETEQKSTRLATKNKSYLAQIANYFGENWAVLFNQEIKQHYYALTTSVDSTKIWHDCVIGYPDFSYYEAKKAVAKAWNINYKITFLGCVVSEKSRKTSLQCRNESKVYLNELTTKLGEDWSTRFNIEIQKQHLLIIQEEMPVKKQ